MTHRDVGERGPNQRLWEDFARTHDPQLREQLIHRNEPLAYNLAFRLAGGRDQDDVVQAALVGLIAAVDRFDPSRDRQFSSFATPTIVGQIKHHFEGSAWKLHVPRSLRLLAHRLQATADGLAQALGRAPTLTELGRALHVPEDLVREALVLLENRRTVSWEGVAEAEDDGAPGLAQLFGDEDQELEHAETRLSLAQAVHALPEHLQELVRLRYFCGMSQREAARSLEVSQSTVSRMECQAINALRHQFSGEPPPRN